MYIYRCVLIGGAILLICSAETPSNLAMSSQSYDRGDVSLSYKYSLVHQYTTLKPELYLNRNPINKYHIKKYQNIQYAPLILKPKEQNSSIVLNQQNDTYRAELNSEINASIFDNENRDERDQTRQEKKRYLFPQAVTKEYEAHPRIYIPGYNVNLEAVKNKLKQTGFYASNPNFLVKNKQVNVNFLQPQVTYKNQDNRKALSPSNEIKAKGAPTLLNHKYLQDGKKNNGIILPVAGRNEKRSFFYVKAPKVELNLARGQHIAHAMHKASVNVNSSFRKLPSLSHDFFSYPQILQPAKTQLIPV